MQWLIDLILESLKGIIVQWSGAVVDIPTGWHLCDGTEGTPDLRDRFVVGAGNGYAVGATGGNVNHTHDFTSDSHTHTLTTDENNLPFGDPGTLRETTGTVVTGTTDNKDGRPPYYALAYIQKV